MIEVALVLMAVSFACSVLAGVGMRWQVKRQQEQIAILGERLERVEYGRPAECFERSLADAWFDVKGGR